MEDGVADIVVGFACFEAEACGELTLGEIAEFPESNHADLLLDGLILGEGDGLPGTVSQHEIAVFDLHGDVKSDLHGHPLPRGSIDAPRGRQIRYTQFMHKVKRRVP